jgi:hypothetical protein
MKATLSGAKAVALIAALLLTIFAGCNEDEPELDEGFECDQGYELVFDLAAQIGGSAGEYRYWFYETDQALLSGKVQDKVTGSEYASIGETTGEGGYRVTFGPEANYLGFDCESGLSFTADLRRLAGTLTVYCGIEPLEKVPAEALVECDATGVSL